ncbi:hypothetical protein LCGC14_0310520 [marine sediment metagenome]|uniref:Uncharacterized protein n=1 Tax=marine sediment metagenome TaxID=412755 RepID=A0A0F9TSB2_9ZZZZ
MKTVYVRFRISPTYGIMGVSTRINPFSVGWCWGRWHFVAGFLAFAFEKRKRTDPCVFENCLRKAYLSLAFLTNGEPTPLCDYHKNEV